MGGIVVQVSVEKQLKLFFRSFDTIEANLVTDRANFPTTVWFSTRKKNSWEEVLVKYLLFHFNSKVFFFNSLLSRPIATISN